MTHVIYVCTPYINVHRVLVLVLVLVHCIYVREGERVGGIIDIILLGPIIYTKYIRIHTYICTYKHKYVLCTPFTLQSSIINYQKTSNNT